MERGLWSAGGLEGGEVNEGAGRRGNSFPGEAPVGCEVGGGGGGSGREGTRCRGERHGGVDVITSSTTAAETKIANKPAGGRGRTVRRREGGKCRGSRRSWNRRRKGKIRRNGLDVVRAVKVEL